MFPCGLILNRLLLCPTGEDLRPLPAAGEAGGPGSCLRSRCHLRAPGLLLSGVPIPPGASGAGGCGLRGVGLSPEEKIEIKGRDETLWGWRLRGAVLLGLGMSTVGTGSTLRVPSLPVGHTDRDGSCGAPHMGFLSTLQCVPHAPVQLCSKPPKPPSRTPHPVAFPETVPHAQGSPTACPRDWDFFSLSPCITAEVYFSPGLHLVGSPACCAGLAPAGFCREMRRFWKSHTVAAGSHTPHVSHVPPAPTPCPSPG